VHDVAPDQTAFPARDARFALNIAGIWPEPKDNQKHVAWVRDYYAAVHPHSGYEAGYTNFMAEDDRDRVRENYGTKHTRLQEIKRRWDPDNVFRLNQNIEPGA
jgi:hypothetical protein